MSFEAMTWASKKKLKNASQKLVLLMLADHSNGHTGQCNPSHKKLAEECCMSISSLKNQIKDLENLGFLSIVHKSQDGVSLPNQYVLNLENEDLDGRVNSDGVGQPLTGGGSNLDGGVGQPLTGGGSNLDGGVGQPLTGGGSKSGYKPVIKPGNNNQEDNLEREPALEKTEKVAKFDYKKFETPPQIDRKKWDEWQASRKSNKAKMTERSLTTCLQDLIEIKNAGFDVNEAMQEAIKREWIGLGHWIEKMKKSQIGTVKTKNNFNDLPDYTLSEKYRTEPNLSDGAIDSTATPFFSGFIGGDK